MLQMGYSVPTAAGDGIELVNPADIIRAMPKVELHVHLEGTMRPDTLLELSCKNGVEIPATTVEGVRRYYQFRDFTHFIDVWIMVNRCLTQPEDFERLVWEYGEDGARQSLRYAEVTFTPLPHVRQRGIPMAELLGALSSGRDRVKKAFGVDLQWVPDHPRNDGPELAWETLELVLAGRDQGVVALGLGGSERDWPPELFRDVFPKSSQLWSGKCPSRWGGRRP